MSGLWPYKDVKAIPSFPRIWSHYSTSVVLSNVDRCFCSVYPHLVPNGGSEAKKGYTARKTTLPMLPSVLSQADALCL